MKAKYPNASLLTIITQLRNNKESVLFLVKKTLPDFYSLPNMHWYKGYGSNGVPKNVWPKLSIRQWCVCGNDDDIEDLFNNIIENKKLIIGSESINLKLPRKYSQIEDTDYYYQRGDEVSLCFITENNDLIPSEFYQKHNLKILSGYEKGTEIKPLFPLGIFEEDFIYRNVSNGVWAIRETRRSYTTFRGTRTSSVKGIGSKEIIGFYQNPYLSTGYSCAIYNEEDNIIGESVINKDNGLFEIKLQQPTINIEEMPLAGFVHVKSYLKIISDSVLVSYVHLTERHEDIWNPASEKQNYQFNAGRYFINLKLSEIVSTDIKSHYEIILTTINNVKVAQWPFERAMGNDTDS